MDGRNPQTSTADLMIATGVILLASIVVSVLDLTNADISRLAVLTILFTMSLALFAKRHHLV